MKFIHNYLIKDILQKLNYTDNIIGNKDDYVSGFSDDFFAKDHELTWTNKKSTLIRLLKTRCNLLIITNLIIQDCPNNNTIIYCENPLRMFESIINRCFFWPNKALQVGQNTIIHNSVIIGENVLIGDNCIIDPYVVIGDNTIIGDNVHIGSFTTIGNQPYYTIWNEKKILRTRSIYGNVCIAKNVQIGSYCSIDNGITTTTEIGTGSKLANFIEIGHDVRIGRNCCICAQSAIGGFVSINEGCVLWGRVGIANRINIAANTTILAASVVTKNIKEEGKIYCGYPAIERIKYWKSIHDSKLVGHINQEHI